MWHGARKLLRWSRKNWMVAGPGQPWGWRKTDGPEFFQVGQPDVVTRAQARGLHDLALDLLLSTCLTMGESLNSAGPQFPNLKNGNMITTSCVYSENQTRQNTHKSYHSAQEVVYSPSVIFLLF